MIFWAFRFVFFNKKKRFSAILALLFCFGIELLQFYHAPWIETLRQTTIGGLILGFSFLWSDILCYTIGILIVFSIDSFTSRRNRS
ncbi:MAG: DUF2809 domain-containing protein [Bacteroidia bacterium]|nr:DUF2809 domain-containing protein [Bacteroidia bacterium]